VHVVIFVAGEAGGTIFFLLGVAAVAIVAGDVFVCTLEREFGVFIVRKGSMAPFAIAMATTTFAPVASGMLVIMLMAVKTSFAQLDSVELASMAGVACHRFMGAL